MATSTPNQSTIDERIREAWGCYRDALADLEGRQYDAVEVESWARLQDALRIIEAEPPAVPGS